MEEQQNSKNKIEEDNNNEENYNSSTSLNNQIEQEAVGEISKSPEPNDDPETNYLDNDGVENPKTNNYSALIEKVTDISSKSVPPEITEESVAPNLIDSTELKDITFDQKNKEKLDIEISKNKESSSTIAISSEETLPPFSDYSDEKLDQNSVDKLGRNKNFSVKITVELLPPKKRFEAEVLLGQKLDDLGDSLGEQFKIPADALGFVYKGETVARSTTFFELGITENEVIQVSSLQPQKYAMFEGESSANTKNITVRVDKGEGQHEEIKVAIDIRDKKKPFLGGFRHKVTGAQYHNASAQTNPKPLRWPKTTLYNRDAQTVSERKQVTQTTNTTSTQMTKPGIYVSVLEDKVIEARPYFTADQWLALRYHAVMVLQRNWRRWLAVQYCNKLRRARDRRLEWEKEREEVKILKKEELIRKDIERRMNPRRKEDFDLVYAALEKWRRQELENINNEMLDEPTRKAALCALLEQHSQLIASIGQHKNQADKLNKESAIQKLLNKAAAPHRWRAYDGKTTEMDTQDTIRAKEMRDLYNSVTLKYLTQDERLDVLLTLKHTVKEYDCNLTRDIIQLIDREADLIMRGVSDKNLEGLRQRIATLFLQFCKNPTFNPEIAKHLKVPADPSVLRKNIFYCNSTQKYLHSSDFDLGSNSNTAGRSKKANDLDNIARKREDNLKYRQILTTLRRDETQYNDGSNIALVFQEKELQYLVETVWMSSSIISAWDDIRDLKLIRWVASEPWSPWNCLLVTKDEAIAHQRITNLNKAYGEVFVTKVQQKHTIAKAYFRKIPQLSRLFTEQSRRLLGGAKELKTRKTVSLP